MKTRSFAGPPRARFFTGPPRGSCRQCGKPVQGTGEYVPLTCGKSACQQAEVTANLKRTDHRKRP